MRYRGTAVGVAALATFALTGPALGAPVTADSDAPRTGTAAAAAQKAAATQARNAAKAANTATAANAPSGTAPTVTTASGAVTSQATSAYGDAAVVSLTFDDQRASQKNVVNPLDSRGFKGTFYVISQFVNTPAGSHPESLDMTQLKSLQAAGHEIGGHSRTHADLPTLSAAGQQGEICGGRQDLLNDGFTRVTSFAYPYGDYDATTKSIVQTCYANGRTVADGPDSIPPFDEYATAAITSVDRTTTVDQLKAAVQSAQTSATQKWVQLVWHDVVGPGEQAEDQYAQSVAEFDSFLSWLQAEVTAGRAVVRTVGQVVP